MADTFTITGTLTSSVFEDGTLTGGGQLKVDEQTSGFVAYQQSSEYGSFTLLASGAWTYSLNNNAALVQAV